MPETNSFPTWEHEKPPESLHKIYLWTIQNAESQIEWYEKKKNPLKLASKLIRFLSILLAGIGALCPLIDATKVFGNLILSQWGYVFLALAAGIAGFDYYFGYSSGWMRKIVTQISLERVLKEFQYDWAILQANAVKSSSDFNPLAFLNLAKDFTSRIENLVKDETDAWVAEFQTNITQLEKVLKTETEVRKQGSIKISVKNAAEFEKVDVFLNDNFVKQLEGVSEGIINNIASGRYEIMIIGKRDGKETKASRVVEVQAGVMTAVEFTLNP